MQVSFNHRNRKGLTLDSVRERPPDQCLVVRRVQMYTGLSNVYRYRALLSRNLQPSIKTKLRSRLTLLSPVTSKSSSECD